MPSGSNTPPDKEKVLGWISEWTDFDGGIRLSVHLKRDRAYRNISVQDCRHVLKTGQLEWPPEWDDEYQNWVFKVSGNDLDDSWLELVFCFDHPNVCVFIITGKG